MNEKVIIIGAGLAGLCCARRLQQAGLEFQIFEAEDRVGGRIKTDEVDGFLLDLGFQVFLTSYPEAKEVLDYQALDLKPFVPGAVVRFDGKFHDLTDPFRRPLESIGGLFSPIGSLLDKMRVAVLRTNVVEGRWRDRFRDPEITTLWSLKESGFSDSMIDRFFRPFLGGIFLENELTTSNRFFRFVFRMFSLGDASLPARGMESIPRQIAAGLPDGCISFNSKVTRLDGSSVELENGERFEGSTVVIAADAPAALGLAGGDVSAEGVGVTCIYFSAPRATEERPILILNGEGTGPINNLCFPSVVASGYAPEGKALVSISVLSTGHSGAELEREVRSQLTEWYGDEVSSWELLRIYEIPYALPRQASPALAKPERPVKLGPGLYICGDHRDNASIQGAMVSGRRAAEAIIEDRKAAH